MESRCEVFLFCGRRELVINGAKRHLQPSGQLEISRVVGGELIFFGEMENAPAADGVGLIVIAGKEYGTGSSRDWAAKGPMLLGIKVVLAESYERIHRSNLIGMGVLPLQFAAGEDADTLGISGLEVFDVSGLPDAIGSGFGSAREVRVRARRDSGEAIEFKAVVRIDTPQEIEYYKHGGILQYVLRHLAGRLAT